MQHFICSGYPMQVRITILILTLFLSLAAKAQIQFFKRCSTPLTEIGMSVRELADGRFLQTTSGSAGSSNPSLVAGGINLLTADGQMIDSRLYHLNNESLIFIKSLEVQDGFVTLAAGGNFFNGSKTIVSIHSSDGSIQASYRLTLSSADMPIDMGLLPNGNLMILVTSDYNINYEMANLIEFSLNGELIRNKRYQLPSAELNSTALAIGNSGEIYLTGACNGDIVFSDGFVMKVNENLNLDWGFKVSSYYDDELLDIALDPSGQITVCGSSYHVNYGWNALLVKLDASGNLLNETYYHAGYDEKFRTLSRKDQSLMIAGDAGTFDDRKIMWLEINESGQILRSSKFTWGNPYTNYPSDIQKTSDGGFVLTGDMTNTNGTRDAGVIKTDRFGEVPCWTENWNFENPDSLVVLKNLGVFNYETTVVVETIELVESNLKHVVFPECEIVPPVAQFSNSEVVENCPELCVSLFDSSLYSPDNFQWVIPEGNPSYSTEINPQICFSGNGSYSITLIVSNADGNDTLSRIIKIKGNCPLVVPNVFTPNKDGVNDTFEIGALPQNSRLHIYDRWGLLVFESTNYNNEWKGEGELSAVYFYVLETSEGERIKGNILVLND
jgi:gliding motility-associated-like protein